MTRIRRLFPLALGVAVMLHAPALAHAQVLMAGSIDGQVINAAGDPLRDVRVVATSRSTGATREARSDADGLFTLRFVPPGEYDLLFELLGYAPKRVLDVPVRSAAAPLVSVELRSVSGPTQEIDEQPFAVAGHDRRSSARSQWIGEERIGGLPHGERSLTDLSRLSSLTDDELGAEGLPSSLSSVRYEGVEWRPALPHGATGAAPLAALRAGELVTNGVDVEWGGAAGAVLSGYAAGGAPRTQLGARGTWAGDALPGAAIEPDAGWSDVQAEARVRGALARGRGGFGLGIDARMLGVPRSEAWTGSDAEALIAAEPSGALAGYTSPSVQEGTAVRAFGAMDAPVTQRHRVGGRVLANATSLDAVAGTTRDAAAADALDLLGTVFLASTLDDRWWNHAQLGVTHTSLEHDSLSLAPFLLVPAGLTTARPVLPQTAEQTVVTLQDALGARMGAHDIKVGLNARLARFRYDGIHDTQGTYAFGGLEELSAGSGVLVRTEPVTDDADWSTFGLAGFVQDRWRPTAAVEVLVGARVEAETMPSDEVALDEEWLRLTGVANNAPDEPAIRVSPRAGLTWTPGPDGRWRVELATGVYDGRYDPYLVAGWLADAGTARVRRAVGAVAWPPAGAAGGTTAVRLTVLDQDFAPPRTARLGAAVTRVLAAGTSVQLSATIRRTDNLPRRADLNLTDDPAAQDQHGRAVYGTLVKQGGLLVEDPGTSRRFAEYDEVAAVSADGESKYWGVTVALDHAAPLFDVFARYTFSRTEDDWFGARDGGGLRALPPGFESWTDATSDFDVPHRAVLGAVVEAPFGFTVSGLYRMQSGMPFTPGYRAGVDANADGIAGNDPAFVDAAVPGMSELMSAWSCLAEASGGFAERNACRADPVHTLDASASLRLFTAGGVSASVLVEAFDLLDAERRTPDAALYLVDPDAPLEVNGATVTVPLVANPAFGEPRAWPLGGRTLRAGLSLNW